MAGSRLNGWAALLNVHNDRRVDIDLVVNEFGRKNKKMQLEDWSI